MDARVKYRNVPYCVYTHSYGDDIFYVGCGLPMRPYQVDSRNDVWEKITGANPDYDISVLGTFRTLKAARLAEFALIKSINPRANIHGTENVRKQAPYRTRSIRPRGSDPLPAGRPGAPIDWPAVTELVKAGASVRLVANRLGMGHGTAQRSVSHVRRLLNNNS